MFKGYSVGKASAKIQGVVDRFQSMIDDLSKGIMVLQSAVRENVEAIDLLKRENAAHDSAIEGAAILRRKLEALLVEE